MTPPPPQSRERSDREVWISFAIASLALVAACIVAFAVM